jgi:hypothetical protein
MLWSGIESDCPYRGFLSDLYRYGPGWLHNGIHAMLEHCICIIPVANTLLWDDSLNNVKSYIVDMF